MKKALIALLVAAGLVTVPLGSAPADASPRHAEPLHWNVTTSDFGPFHIGENLQDVARTSHLDYSKQIATWFKAAHAARGRASGYCLDGGAQTKILLLKDHTNRQQIKAVIQTPCTSSSTMTYPTFVKRFHPYTTGSTVLSFESYLRSDEGQGSVASGRSYGPYMPHANGIYIDYRDSDYAKLRREFKGYRFDTHLMTSTKSGNEVIHNGPVGVYETGSHAEIWFYFNRDYVEEIQQTTKTDRPYWEG